MKLPATFGEIADEIVLFTGLPRNEVENRIWMEALEPGWNVCQDARRFGVRWHHYDEHMEQLYREGDGFIFETMVFWCKPYRRRWTELALERIRDCAVRSGVEPADISILALGDGTGNDSLLLAGNGLRVHYFDVPGSRTFDFAVRRFEQHALLGDRITPVSCYEECLAHKYDAVVCYEVLEHLPDPRRTIHEISTMLKPGGIALITEDFGDVVPHLPTHLASNDKYIGKTVKLFLRSGLALRWYSREVLFRPAEFVKMDNVGTLEWLRLLRDPNVRGAYLSPWFNHVARFMNKIPYYRS